MISNNYKSYIIYNVPVLYITTPQPQQIISEFRPSSIIMNTPSQIQVSNNTQNIQINDIPISETIILNKEPINESKNNNKSIPNIKTPPEQNIIFNEYKTTNKKSTKESQINDSNNKNNAQNQKEIKTIKKFEIDPNNTLLGKNVTKAMPVYNLIRQGKGISTVEEQGIVFCAMAIYQEEMEPLSNNTARYIKKKLGGDWLVIVYPDEKNADFFLSSVSRNDFMYFTLDTTAYQVFRLR